MAMKFLCPNGHEIQCPDDRGGRQAKCSRCGVLMLIPKPPVAEDFRAVELFEFLCPNDHLLSSPVSHAGRRSRCPRCQAEFEIPQPPRDSSSPGSSPSPQQPEQAKVSPSQAGGEPDPEPAMVQSSSLPQGIPDPFAPELEPASAEPPPVPQPATPPPVSETALSLDQLAPAVPGSEEGKPAPEMAQVFETLWNEVEEEAVFELVLEDGQRFVPVSYAEKASQGAVGLFAAATADGHHEIYLVPWSRVVRVTVRGVKQLPPKLFE